MTLLGLDTSTAATAVCILGADERACERVPEVAALSGRPAHARELMPAVVELMDEAGMGFDQLEAVAVGIGPGGYTGLRIGIATARAIAQGRGLPLLPVSSLAALAAGVEGRPALAVIDARRGEVFAGLYEDGEVRQPPFVARPEEISDRIRSRLSTRPASVAVGDGSLRFRKLLEAAGVEVAPDGSRLHVVRALHVCRIAQRVAPAAPEAVSPDYLRAPDATPAR